MEEEATAGGDEPRRYFQVAVWWLIAAGLLLLLPRQWASAGIAFGLAGVAYAIDRRRNGAEAKVTPVDE